MKTRIRASIVHLLISATVILAFTLTAILIWYRPPLNELHGVFDVLKLVVAVDVVLGPLLTLVVFNIEKPRAELIRDMSFIVLVQLAALGWGVYSTYKVRPVFVVFHADTLYSVTRDDVLSQGDYHGSVRMPGVFSPPLMVYSPPLDEKQVVQHVMDMLNKGVPDAMYLTDRYVPLDGHKDQVLSRAMDLKDTAKAPSKSQLDQFVAAHGGKLEDYFFYPIEFGPFKSIAGLRRDDLSMVDLLGGVK